MSLTFQDKFEIHELISRYANSFDNGKFDEWLDTWTEDGIWDGPAGVHAGKTALAKLVEVLGGNLQSMRRVVTNIVVAGDANLATAECYMLVIERNVSTEIRATSTCADILKKEDGNWKFAKRVVRMDPNCIPKV